MLSGLVAEQQVNRVFHGGAEVAAQHLIAGFRLFPHALQDRCKFLGRLFGQGDDMIGVGTTTSRRPPLNRVESVLFVVDTVTTKPGTSGQIWVDDVKYAR